jgi:hypothetical protein
LFVVAGPVQLSQAVVDEAVACVHRIRDEQNAACTRAIQSGRWSGQGLASVYASCGIGAQRQLIAFWRATADDDEDYVYAIAL